MAGNDHLVAVLQRLLDSHESQEQWVRKDSDFDDQSRRIMLDLVAGQKTCAIEFKSWVDGLDYELPVSLVADETTPDAWCMQWDGESCDGMSDLDGDMLDALQYIVFNGESYRPENVVIEELLGKGMPSRLRKDVEKS